MNDASLPRIGLVGLLTCFLMLSSQERLSADIVIRDGFTPVGEGRRVSGELNGATTEQGGAKWVSDPRFKFGGNEQDGWIEASSETGGHPARIAIPAGAVVVKVEVDFQFDKTEAPRWVGLGIAGSDGVNRGYFKRADGMLLCLDNRGWGRFCAGPEATNIGGKQIAGVGDKMNHLTLIYNIASKTVSAWINEAPLCKEDTACPVEIKAEYVGFACFGVGSGAKIDNFVVTVQGGAAEAK